MIVQYAMKNPNVVFTSPETLERSPEFTSVQKRAILTQWKDQLQQLLIADEESMLRADPTPGTDAECLRRVTDSMTRLYLEDMRGNVPPRGSPPGAREWPHRRARPTYR